MSHLPLDPGSSVERSTPLDATAFVLVAVAFSRVSESVESMTGLLPISSVLALVVIGLVVTRPTERRASRPMLAVAVGLAVLQLAVLAFSAVGARDMSLSLAKMDGTLRAVVVMLAAVLVIRTPRRLELALRGIATATLVVATASCVQAATGAYEATFGGLARAEFAALDQESGWRLGGPVGDPNFFAQMLAVGAIVSIALVVFERGAWRLVALAATATGTVALLLTYSRGGLLAVALAASILAVRLLAWRAVLAGIVVAGLILGAAPSALMGRISTAASTAPKALAGEPVADTAINGRASEAIVGFEQFSDHWLLGVGAGNYEARYLDYARSVGLDLRGEERSAHNLVLEVLAETGILGLGVFAATVLLAFAAVGRLRATSQAEAGARHLWGMGLAVEAALVAHLATAVFLHGAYPRGYWLLLGVALACGQVTPSHPRARGPALALVR